MIWTVHQVLIKSVILEKLRKASRNVHRVPQGLPKRAPTHIDLTFALHTFLSRIMRKMKHRQDHVHTKLVCAAPQQNSVECTDLLVPWAKIFEMHF